MPVENPNPLSLDDYYQKSEEIISRKIAGEAVLVPLRRNAADLYNIYALNETAALVWETLDGTHTLRHALERVMAEFEVEEPEAEKDLLSLIAHLESLGAIIRFRRWNACRSTLLFNNPASLSV